MSGDLAWKERVTAEDRRLLAHIIETRRRLVSETPPSRSTPTPTGGGGRLGGGGGGGGLPPVAHRKSSSSSNVGTNGHGNTVPSSCGAGSTASGHRRVAQMMQGRVSPAVGTSVQHNNVPSSSASSVAPSAAGSSRSTQLSHHGVSTVQGSRAISDLTMFSTRLEKIEQRLQAEHAERQRVYTELSEIKKLLMQAK